MADVGRLKSGTLVRFTMTVYQDWGLGVVLHYHDIKDREGRSHPGYYMVFTQRGEKVVSDSFMEVVSEIG